MSGSQETTTVILIYLSIFIYNTIIYRKWLLLGYFKKHLNKQWSVLG